MDVDDWKVCRDFAPHDLLLLRTHRVSAVFQRFSVSPTTTFTGPNKPDSLRGESFLQYFHVLNVFRPLFLWKMEDGRWEMEGCPPPAVPPLGVWSSCLP